MKAYVQNRHGMMISIQVEDVEKPKGLAFIMHGFKGFKEQPHIRLFAEAFAENGFRVVTFDATNALGESDGQVVDATYGNYISDLEDVIDWARDQEWFMQPFALGGHSMGAQTVSWFAEHHPSEVSLLAPMAPPVNYDLHVYNDRNATRALELKERGYIIEKSVSKPGVEVKVSWNTTESMKEFDIVPLACNLTMPVLDIVGELDQPCPVSSQKEFFAAIANDDKMLVVMPGLDHNYRNVEKGGYDETFPRIKVIISEWLRNTSEK